MIPERPPLFYIMAPVSLFYGAGDRLAASARYLTFQPLGSDYGKPGILRGLGEPEKEHPQPALHSDGYRQRHLRKGDDIAESTADEKHNPGAIREVGKPDFNVAENRCETFAEISHEAVGERFSHSFLKIEAKVS